MLVVLGIIFGIVFGVVYAQVLEWSIHRYILHGKKLGKKKGHPLSFHFHQHHKVVRNQRFHDPAYDGSIFNWDAGGQEAFSLLVLAIIHSPLVLIAPGVAIGATVGMVRYYYIHRKSHLNPEWCKKKLPWHYEHHMAPNQDANWGVTAEWMDLLMGTRVHYIGTDREDRDEVRRRRRSTVPLPV